MVTIMTGRATHWLMVKDLKANKHEMVSFISDKPLDEIYGELRKFAEEL